MAHSLIIAHHPGNAETVKELTRQLPGIEALSFAASSDMPPGAFAARLQESDLPVLLLLTDNFLKDLYCMTDMLPSVLGLLRQNRLLTLVADGLDEKGKPVETHIDRVVYVIQYLNHWQTAWLEQSNHVEHLPAADRAYYQPQLDATHAIANQMGEFINTLRENDPLTWRNMVDEEYRPVYMRFGWAKPYVETPPPISPIDPGPAKIETAGGGIIQPPNAGPITFRPIQPERPPQVHISVQVNAGDESPQSEPPQYSQSDIEATIKDAWFWLSKGHHELGMGVFKFALEQHPNHPQLTAEYEKALRQYGPPEEVDESGQESIQEEAASYAVMGDGAHEQGDYLMAKYFWDKCIEIDPDHEGVFKKLALLTARYLPGYEETGKHYLQQALLRDPDDETLLGLQTEATQPPAEPSATTPEPEPPIVRIETHVDAPEVVQEVEDPGPTGTIVFENAPETLEAAEPEVKTVPQAAPPVETRTVLITGATSGIGKATAAEFARHGWRVIITGRRAERLAETEQYLTQQFGVEALTLCFDVRNQPDVERHLLHLPAEWSTIDVLVNNAGLAKGLAPIHEGDLDHWETMIDTNLKGLLYVTRCISPGMVARRKGHIVNLSSSAGKEAYANGGVYCATKFAVEALTRGMRLDLHKYGIRVSEVSPGHVEETEFAITRFDGDAEKARIYDDFQPLKATDVAEAIYFIASRPAHVNIQDIWMFGTQQAAATVIDRSGRG